MGCSELSLTDYTEPQWLFPIEETKVREFASAVKAPKSESGDVSVPPTFPIFGSIALEGMGLLKGLDLDPRRVLHGEQEYEYVRPLRLGDRLICQTRIADDYEKAGKRGGRMRFIVLETEMRDEKTGDLVVRAWATSISRGRLGE